MQCKIIRDFRFSRNGYSTEDAVAGSEVNIPDALVAGLEAEGYLSTKMIKGASENKMAPPLKNKGTK